MGPLKQFYITYANNQQVFYPGQVLAGQVFLEITEPVDTRGVRITLHGESYVHWSEHHNSGQSSHTVSYTDRDRYLNQCITLWGKEEGDKSGANPTLPPGMHTFSFSFSFQLPTGLPSSFERSSNFRAHIRYWVHAKVDRPWKFDYKTKRPFTVIEYIDINNPVFLRPARSENDKHLCCLCCKSGPLSLQASIDRAGYCPGESVMVSASAENLTNREMQGIRAQLISVTNVVARGHRRSDKKVVCEVMGQQLPIGVTDRWQSRPLVIPPAPPSIKCCRIIDHSYFVQVCVVVPRGVNLKIHFPVVIGTIPLREVAPPPLPMDQIAYIDNRSLGMTGLPPAFAMPQEEVVVPSAPPSYAEATGAPSINIAEPDDQYTRGSLLYAPLYPFASSGAPPPTLPSQAPMASGNAFPAQPPYPAYPQADQLPYPQADQLPYPQQSHMPYPHDSQAPYPPQYPQAGGIPLQPMGQQVPGYPPGKYPNV